MAGQQTYKNETPQIAGIKIQSSAYGQCIPWVVGGMGRAAGNLLWYGAFRAIKHTETTDAGGKGGGGGAQQQTITYTYEAAMMVGLARGPIVDVKRVWRAKEALSSLYEAGLSLATGEIGQPIWSWLQSYHPGEALAYSGLAHVYAPSYRLDSAASLENHNFEVDAGGIGPVPGEPGGAAIVVADACPRLIFERIATDPRSGARWPLDLIDGLPAYQTYCRAHGLWFSPVLTERRPAVDWLRHLLMLTNTRAAWTGARLELVPLGDTSRSAHGADYAPDRTPDFDLTLDDFAPDDGEPPVRVRRHQGLVSEAELATADDVGYNVITVECENRANAYALEPVSRDDLAHIERYGHRPREPIKAPEIKVPAIAAQVAQQLLQDELAKRNRYEFKLTWRHSRLRPLRLVTLTEPALELDRTPVRILSVEEGDDRKVTIVAEDAPLGIASAPRYGHQAGQGFAQDYRVAPGTVADIHVFEAPAQLAGTTGLEVYCAVRSPGPSWGGARVWVSLDGNTYREISRITGSARMGVLTGAVAAESITLNVSGMSGQLLSGSASDAAALSTLCYLGGAQPEYLAYESAALTGPGAYQLGGLVRGAYSSAGRAHAAGDRLVRIDSAIARSGPLDTSLIGGTVYFKFTSFNVFGAAEQSLADVSAVPYAIVGAFAQQLPGLGGKGLVLKSSSLTVKKAVDDSLLPLSIDLAAELKGTLQGEPVWTIVSGSADLVGTGLARTLDTATITSPTLTIRVELADEIGVYTDQITIAVVVDGSGTGTPGTPGASLQVEYSADNINWHATLDPINDLYRRERIGTGAWSPGYLFKGTPGAPGDPGQAGQKTVELSIYAWSPTVPPSPAGAATYTWASATLSGYTGDGTWSIDVPANPGTAGLKLWVAKKSVTAPGGDTTTTVSFAGAAIAAVSANGQAGTPGLQVATARVYQWAQTIPSAPSGSGTYIWASAGVAAAPAGWSLAGGGAPTPGWTLWAADVPLAAAAGTATSAIAWSTAAVIAIGYAGTAGGPGQAGASSRIAYAVINGSSLASSPASVQTAGNGSFPANGTWGGGEVWGSAVPAYGVGQSVQIIDGIYNPASGLTTWSAPYLASLKVGSLSAISANLGSINAGEISIGGGRFAVSNTGYLVAKGIQVLDDAGNVVLSTKAGASASLPASWVTAAPAWLNSNLSLDATGRLLNGGVPQGQIESTPILDRDRSVDRPPTYYPMGTTREFKVSSAIGVSGSYYCTLETIKQFAENQGGYPGYQYAYAGSLTWRRQALNDAGSGWTPWIQDLDRNSYTGDLNATNGATFGTNIWGSINSANVSTYIGSAAIGLAHINTATFGSLSALSANLGYCTAGQIHGGSIHGGDMTGWAWPTNGGGGFYLGWSGAAATSGLLMGNYNTGKYIQIGADGNIYAPQFSIVNGVASFAGLLNLGLMSVDIGSDLSTSVFNGYQQYGARSASVSGGRAPFTYTWSVEAMSGVAPSSWPNNINLNGGTSDTVYIAGYGINQAIEAELICVAIDANGRSARASITIYAQHSG